MAIVSAAMNMAVPVSLWDVVFSTQLVHLEHMGVLVLDFRETSKRISILIDNLTLPLAIHKCSSFPTSHHYLLSFSNDSHSEWDEIESQSSLAFPCRARNVDLGAREMTQRLRAAVRDRTWLSGMEQSFPLTWPSESPNGDFICLLP